MVRSNARIKKPSDTEEPQLSVPSPSTNAWSIIQCMRSKLGFIPKSLPMSCRRSTVIGEPSGSTGFCASSASARAATALDVGRG